MSSYTYVTRENDIVGREALKELEKQNEQVRILATGEEVPPGSVLICHRPQQPGYVCVASRNGGKITIGIRKSRRESRPNAFAKASRSIPTLAEREQGL